MDINEKPTNSVASNNLYFINYNVFMIMSGVAGVKYGQPNNFGRFSDYYDDSKK